jgi:hypothetical protein
MVMKGELVGRAVTTEVSSGLTCIGDSVSSYAANSLSLDRGSSTAGSETGSMTSSASAASATSLSSTGGMPMVTPGPVLAMGALGAAAAFAYGAM